MLIDGVPSLLMDISFSSGERMKTYTFFVKQYPNHSFALAVKSAKGISEGNEKIIEEMLSSLKISTGKKG